MSLWDSNPVLPRRRTAGETDASGCALELMAACADDWGVYDTVGLGAGSVGKAVWFRLEA